MFVDEKISDQYRLKSEESMVRGATLQFYCLQCL